MKFWCKKGRKFSPIERNSKESERKREREKQNQLCLILMEMSEEIALSQEPAVDQNGESLAFFIAFFFFFYLSIFLRTFPYFHFHCYVMIRVLFVKLWWWNMVGQLWRMIICWGTRFRGSSINFVTIKDFVFPPIFVLIIKISIQIHKFL